MEKTLKQTTWYGILLVMGLGTLLHFTYQWSGKQTFVGLFSAVNESTWEHMKLLFFPSFIYFLIERRYTARKYPSLLTCRTLGLLLGLAFIPISFYTYTGVIGKSFAPVDIAIFFVSALITFLICQPLRKCRFSITPQFSLLILFGLLFCFVIFTFFPPHIGLFLDPVSFTYGI